MTWCMCWEQNLGSLKEQYMFLTAGTSLKHPLTFKQRKHITGRQRYVFHVLTAECFPEEQCQLKHPICIVMLPSPTFLPCTFEKYLERPSTSLLSQCCLLLCAGDLKLWSWQSTVTSHLSMPMAIYHSYHCLYRIWYYWPWTFYWKVCYHWPCDTLSPLLYPSPQLHYSVFLTTSSSSWFLSFLVLQSQNGFNFVLRSKYTASFLFATFFIWFCSLHQALIFTEIKSFPTGLSDSS